MEYQLIKSAKCNGCHYTKNIGERVWAEYMGTVMDINVAFRFAEEYNTHKHKEKCDCRVIVKEI